MALPGQLAVDPRFTAQAQQGEGLQQRIKRFQTEGQTQTPGAPGVPEWLPTLGDPFDRGKAADRAGQLTSQLSSVTGLADPANRLEADKLLARQTAAQARLQADSEARAARGQEFVDAAANQQYDFGAGGGGGAGGEIKFPKKFRDQIDPYSNRETVLASAKKLLGTDYLYGGGGGLSRGRKGPTYGSAHGFTGRGIDCSGLTDYAFSSIGLKIGGSTFSQMPWARAHGKRVPTKNLVPGDLVFGGSPGAPHHVAIYWGNGKIIEAMQTGTKVHIVPMRSGQYGMHLNY